MKLTTWVVLALLIQTPSRFMNCFFSLNFVQSRINHFFEMNHDTWITLFRNRPSTKLKPTTYKNKNFQGLLSPPLSPFLAYPVTLARRREADLKIRHLKQMKIGDSISKHINRENFLPYFEPPNLADFGLHPWGGLDFILNEYHRLLWAYATQEMEGN